MKFITLPLLMTASTFFSGCAYVPVNDADSHPVGVNSSTNKTLEPTAYVYGGRTVFELNNTPLRVFVKDKNGADVPFEKVGRHYRLDRILTTFTVFANGNSVTFAATPSPNPNLIALQAKPAPPSDADLLKLATKQLDQVRAELEFSRKNKNLNTTEFSTINARLDEIETQVLTAATNIVNVSFPLNSTVFSPNEAVGKALIDSAKNAERINVRGRTDSLIPGPSDARIALGRALSARTYLLENGIASNKINVFSKAAGSFAGENKSEAGKSINRRVEIEFMNAQIAKLHTQTVALVAADKSTL